MCFTGDARRTSLSPGFLFNERDWLDTGASKPESFDQCDGELGQMDDLGGDRAHHEPSNTSEST